MMTICDHKIAPCFCQNAFLDSASYSFMVLIVEHQKDPTHPLNNIKQIILAKLFISPQWIIIALLSKKKKKKNVYYFQVR